MCDYTLYYRMTEQAPQLSISDTQSGHFALFYTVLQMKNSISASAINYIKQQNLKYCSDALIRDFADYPISQY